MRKMFLLGLAVLPVLASKASATIVYDNTGVDGLFTDGIASIYFDDATAAGMTAPFQINQLDLGYQNMNTATSNFDILIQFYNTVNYAAASGVPVGTSPIGSLIDITGKSLAGSSIDETGLINLPGTLPISTTGTVGFEFEFVTPGSTAFAEANIDPDITPIFRESPPVLGSSNDEYAFDYLNEDSIVGDDATGDIFTFATPGNVYAELGAIPVPEPTSIALLGAGSMMLLARRKRAAN